MSPAVWLDAFVLPSSQAANLYTRASFHPHTDRSLPGRARASSRWMSNENAWSAARLQGKEWAGKASLRKSIPPLH
jgi:hypothetical protein